MTSFSPPPTPVQGGLTDAFQPAQTGQSVGYAPPPTDPTDTAAPGVQTTAAHPNGAPVEAPKPTFWTWEEAQAAKTMNPNFQSRVDALIKASGGRVWLTSGFRDNAKQRSLYKVAVDSHGEADAGNWVAHPHDATHKGSNHERGEAADIHGDMEWLHQNAAQYGLVFPMSWEPWHVEPAGLRTQSAPDAYTPGPVGSVNPTQDTTIDSQPSEVAATTASLLSTMTGAQTSPGASISKAVTGGLTDQTGQIPGAATIPGTTLPADQTRSGTVAAPGELDASGGTVPLGKAEQVDVNPQPASASQEDYIREILPHVQRESARTGIPVEVMIVQSGIETGWGTSGWWKNQRNPAGIGVTGAPGKGFSYASLEEAFHDYAEKLLGNGEAGQQQFVADLKAGASAERLLADIQQSPWAAGHYGGNGLVQTYGALKNAGVFQAVAAPVAPAAPSTAPAMQPAIEGAPKKKPVSRTVRRR